MLNSFSCCGFTSFRLNIHQNFVNITERLTKSNPVKRRSAKVQNKERKKERKEEREREKERRQERKRKKERKNKRKKEQKKERKRKKKERMYRNAVIFEKKTLNISTNVRIKRLFEVLSFIIGRDITRNHKRLKESQKIKDIKENIILTKSSGTLEANIL